MTSFPNSVEVAALKQALAVANKQIEVLQEQLRLVLAQLYGPRADRLFFQSSLLQQLNLFEGPTPEPIEKKPEKTSVPAHDRKKPGRKQLPDNLPRREVIEDISEEEKICKCGHMKSRIGQETSERLDYIPARAEVERTVRPKWACKHCEGTEDEGPTVAIAPAPPHILPRGNATEGMLAQVMTGKFVDSIPFYRQEKQLKRIGVDLRRGTMCGWAMKVADACGPLMDLLQQELLSGPVINADETVLQVLDEPGRDPTEKSYLWVFRGGATEHPSVLFVYHPSREGTVPAKYLKGYAGYVQTDAYSGYDFLDLMPGIKHLGCWAHARRNFTDVVKAMSKIPSPTGRPGIAQEAVDHIRELYSLEAKAEELRLSHDQIRDLRDREAKPLLKSLKEWLEAWEPKVPPKSLLGKAIRYALHEWPRLEVYTEEGFLRPDNNLAENAIRPFVIGRKNWLFSATPQGARATATMYSLVETAKANELEPYAYLKCLFRRLPRAVTPEARKMLLPQYLDRSLLLQP